MMKVIYKCVLIPNALWCNQLVRLPGMQKVVGLNPHGGGRNFSHGKLSKILHYILKIQNGCVLSVMLELYYRISVSVITHYVFLF